MVDERLAHLLLVAAAMAVTWDSLICVYLALSPLILTHANTATCTRAAFGVQLYARCGQLDTALTRFLRLGDIAPWCRFGCSVYETPLHVFVHCPTFSSLRTAAAASVHAEVSKLLATAETRSSLAEPLLHTTTALFADDDDVWPLSASRYYLGTMPPTSFDEVLSVPDRRVLTSVVNAWHSASIRLAGRIWGDYKRRTRSSVPRFASVPLHLPPHLLYLLDLSS